MERSKGILPIVPLRTKSRLFQNIIAMFALRGGNYALQLVTVPYLVRVLGPADYGIIAFSQAFINYFVVVVDYGFNLSVIPRIALLRDDKKALSGIVATVMTIKISLATVGFFIVLGITYWVPSFEYHRALYLLSYLAVLGTVLLPIWLLGGIQEMKFMSVLMIVGRAVTVVAIFLFVHSTRDFLSAVVIQSSSYIIAGIPALIMLPRLAKFHLVWPERREILKTLVEGWHAFLSMSSLTIYTSTNVFVLGLIATPAAVGWYSASYKLISAATGIVTPLNQAVYPHIVGLAAKSRHDALTFIKRMLRYQSYGMLVLAIVLFYFAKIITKIMLGLQYAPCVALIRIMAIVPFINSLSTVLGAQTMMVFGMKKLFSRVYLVAALVNIIILVPLIEAGGTAGAAFAVTAIEFLVTGQIVLALAKAGILQDIIASK